MFSVFIIFHFAAYMHFCAYLFLKLFISNNIQHRSLIIQSYVLLLRKYKPDMLICFNPCITLADSCTGIQAFCTSSEDEKLLEWPSDQCIFSGCIHCHSHCIFCILYIHTIWFDITLGGKGLNLQDSKSHIFSKTGQAVKQLKYNVPGKINTSSCEELRLAQENTWSKPSWLFGGTTFLVFNDTSKWEHTRLDGHFSCSLLKWK